MQIFKLYKDELLKMAGETYVDRGIMHSEAFAFISFCKAFSIDMVIESGTAWGQSCYMFSKYLKVPVHTIDNVSHYGDKAQKFAMDRCVGLNVTFHVGDSNTLLPELIKSYSDKRIAVFIDGPKGDDAVILRERVWKFDNVYIAACHDMESSNAIGRFSTANNSEFLNEYQSVFDSVVLKHPYPDDVNKTMGDVYKNGTGIDIKYKPRNVIYYVYTGGVDDLYEDFIQTSKKYSNPTYMCLSNVDSVKYSNFTTKLTEFESGGLMGPKMTALQRLPLVYGDKVFIMDIDTYCNGDVFKVFETMKGSDFLVTSRNNKEGLAAEYSPINAGVWGFTFTKNVEKIFNWFYEQLTNPSFQPWIIYKKNHPFCTTIGIKEWWVDQDLLNVLYQEQDKLGVSVTDIGPEYNWIVSDPEFIEFKDSKHIVLHRKSGTRNRWK